VPALDALLGIDHEFNPMPAYLREMLDYMPAAHRALIVQLERGPAAVYLKKHIHETAFYLI